MSGEDGVWGRMLLPWLVQPVEGGRSQALVSVTIPPPLPPPPQVAGYRVHLLPGKQLVPLAVDQAWALWRRARVECWAGGMDKPLTLRLELGPVKALAKRGGRRLWGTSSGSLPPYRMGGFTHASSSLVFTLAHEAGADLLPLVLMRKLSSER